MGLTLDVGAALGDTVNNQITKSAGLQELPPSDNSNELGKQASAALATLGEHATGQMSTVVEHTTDVPAESHLFSCRAMLDEGSLAAARAIAEQRLPTLLGDPNALGAFGADAVRPLNDLARQLLDSVGKEANVPEIVAITKGLDDRMRAMTSKYSPETLAKTRSQYESVKSSITEFLQKFRDMFAMLVADAKGIQAYLDSLEAQLEDHKKKLSDNVSMCNRVYAANEEAIGRLISVIAIMECVREHAATQARAIDVTSGDALAARQARERREAIVEFIQNIDVRINEFQQRLMVGFATGPQIRNIRAISYGLAQRLTLLQILTIPTWRLVIVEWVKLERAAQSAKAVGAVTDANNLALQAFAHAGRDMVKASATQINTPSTSPETIMLIAESLAAQATGMTEAYKAGLAARNQVGAAIIKGAQIIAQAEDTRAETILKLVTDYNGLNDLTTPAKLSEGELPNFMVKNAQSVLTEGRLAT